MAKSSKPKPATSWASHLDHHHIREAYAEATVDAFGECEQHTALLTAIKDALSFPFRGKVLGNVVQVVGMQWPDGDEFGLDLVYEQNGTRQPIEARSVELLKPLPEGHLVLAAYLDWRRGI